MRTYCAYLAMLSSPILTFWQLIENTSLAAESRATLGRVAASDFVLKHLRAKGVAPKDLQKALNISASQASRMLDGSRGISVWHLDAIADLLGTTVPDLFRDLPDQSIGIEHASNPPPLQGGGQHVDVGSSLGDDIRAFKKTLIAALDQLDDFARRIDRRLAHASDPHTARRDRGETTPVVRHRRRAGG